MANQSIMTNDSDLFSLWNDTLLDYDEVELTAWLLSDFWSTCFAISLALIIVIGVIGNALVIYVSVKIFIDRGPTSTIDVYILHMSIADFLFLIFCVPFQGTVYIFNDWPYGLSMCKLAYYCQYVTMYASVWILVLMSIDRYIAIGHPLRSVQWRSIESATRSSLGVWAASLILSSPVLFLYTTSDDISEATACFDYSITHLEYRRWLILIVFLVSFLVPTLIIFCMALLVSAAIQTSVKDPLFHRGNNSVASGAPTWTAAAMASADPSTGGGRRTGGSSGDNTKIRRRRRVVWLVFALSAWYLFCWLPHSSLLLWLNFEPNVSEWIDEHSWTLFMLKILGHMGTYVHSSLNPFFYSLAYEQFRRRLSHVFMRKKSNSRRGIGGGGASPRASAKMSYSYFYGAPVFHPTATPSLQSTPEKRRGARCASSRV